MKSLILSFSIIYFAFIYKIIAKAEPVLDISGEKLITGVKYYILPVRRVSGGGLTVTNVSNLNSNSNPCPFFVVQENLEVKNGGAVTFTPHDAKQGVNVILTSTDLNIKSYVTTTCPQTQVWKLGTGLSGMTFLSVGGEEGNPGIQTSSNWFKIKKADKDYLFSFCPSICNRCLTMCGELGLYVDDNGFKHLAISHDQVRDQLPPFRVVFKRA